MNHNLEMNNSITKATASNAFDIIKRNYSIFDVAEFCGLQLPERKKFCSPLRPDRNPSCTATDQLFTDWSSGEHLDAPAFYAALRGISLTESRQELLDRLGIARKAPPSNFRSAGRLTTRPAPKSTCEIPQLYTGREFFKELAEVRSVSVEAVSLAVNNLGTIKFFHDNKHKRGWVLTDRSNRAFQGRLITGERWKHGGKTHNFIKGIYPVGISTNWKFPEDFPVLLVEGSGDYLAACDIDLHAEREFIPVAMLGTSAIIPDDCIPFFRGRDVRIIAHPGVAGMKAGREWRRSLRAVCNVTLDQLSDGELDLNDLVKRAGAAAVAKGLRL